MIAAAAGKGRLRLRFLLRLKHCHRKKSTLRSNKPDLTDLLNNLRHESVNSPNQSGQVLKMSGTSVFGKHTFSLSMPIHCPTLTL